jgi:hypothetical protein
MVIALLASTASAQPADPLLAAHDTDPLELALVVERVGDDAVLARLAPETPVAVRALAIVAATELHAPEDALVPLVELARGRDPDLAPRALWATLAIARRLDARTLGARESDVGALAPARAGLEALAADETARADLRRGAQLAAAALAELGASLP